MASAMCLLTGFSMRVTASMYPWSRNIFPMFPSLDISLQSPPEPHAVNFILLLTGPRQGSRRAPHDKVPHRFLGHPSIPLPQIDVHHRSLPSLSAETTSRIRSVSLPAYFSKTWKSPTESLTDAGHGEESQWRRDREGGAQERAGEQQPGEDAEGEAGVEVGSWSHCCRYGYRIIKGFPYNIARLPHIMP
ncbi:hypothetical protein F4778DRAFT_397617 [Xylariomycetidae sp. FL2044]|nr:hypothetical protein F4778DRAFT_397617 [Xylariomycetidae sp. FL2044]